MEGKTVLNISNVCFETIECCNCHMIFAVTDKHRRSLIESHEEFYCPNGHPQSYVGKTDLDKWKDYANNIEEKFENCKTDRVELHDEIQLLSDKKRELEKANRYLKKMKTQYKNKLSQQG